MALLTMFTLICGAPCTRLVEVHGAEWGVGPAFC